MKKIIILLLLFLKPLGADEGGDSFWFPGQFASLLAIPATPGWKMGTKLYYYDHSSSDLEQDVNGMVVSENTSTQSPYFFIEPSYAPDTKWFGGQPFFEITQGFGYNYTKTDGSSQNIWGLSDMYPFAEIAWNKENHNYMVYFMGGIPIGYYNSSSTDNLGTGHFAIDFGFGYTYLNKISGLEGSALFGITYNFTNPETDYKNGLDSHLDWAFSKFLSDKWQVGIVGYVYYQLTGDSGSGNQLGSFKSKAASIGPEGTYIFKHGERDLNFTLRGYYDFWTENRTGGLSIYAILTILI